MLRGPFACGSVPSGGFTTHHRRGGLQTTDIYFSLFSGPRDPRSGRWQLECLARAHFSVHKRLLLGCPFEVEGAQRSLQPLWQGPWFHYSDLATNHFPKAPPPHWALTFRHLNVGGHQHSDYSCLYAESRWTVGNHSKVSRC